MRGTQQQHASSTRARAVPAAGIQLSDPAGWREAGRRLEGEQTEAIAEVLDWLAANPARVPSAKAKTQPRAGGGLVGPNPPAPQMPGTSSARMRR